MRQSLPGTARQTVGPLQTGDARFDPCPKVAKLAINPVALRHLLDLQPLLFVEGYILYAFVSRLAHIVMAGIASVCGHLPGSAAVDLDLSFQQRDKAFAIGRVTLFDYGVENQSATTARQVQLVPILDVAAAFDNDVAVLFE